MGSEASTRAPGTEALAALLAALAICTPASNPSRYRFCSGSKSPDFPVLTSLRSASVIPLHFPCGASLKVGGCPCWRGLSPFRRCHAEGRWRKCTCHSHVEWTIGPALAQGSQHRNVALTCRLFVKAGFGLCEGASKSKTFAERLNCGAGANEFEIPMRVAGVAEQNRAGELRTFDHEFAVGIETSICEQDRVRAFSAKKIAGRKHMNAGHFEIGCVDATAVLDLASG